MTAILSIQSSVVYGHVGAQAGAFALQRQGIAVWSLPTVQLSANAGYPGVRGRRTAPEEIAALGEGLVAHGALVEADGVMTGYLGATETAEAVLALVEAARAANPAAPYLCDPVLGDEGSGLYLPEAVGALYRDRFMALADVVTPNRFELGWLTRMPVETLPEMLAAASALREAGPATVYVTSVADGAGGLGILAVDETGAWLATRPRLAHRAAGAGDMAAALLMGHHLRGTPTSEAAARTVAALNAIVASAVTDGVAELPIVTAQDTWLNPEAPAILTRL
jgi:pyridoxine kinase